MDYKEKILELKSQGLSNKQIVKSLGCSSSTVSYHCNEETRLKILEKKKIKLIENKRIPKTQKENPFSDKELKIIEKDVCWRYTESFCQTELIRLGYEVFLPKTGGGEIDCIACKDEKTLRIQIKSFSPEKDSDRISISLSRTALNYKSAKHKKYSNIDLFLIYDGNYVYAYWFKDLIGTNLNLRYSIPKNMQIKHIKMASDYLIEKILV